MKKKMKKKTMKTKKKKALFLMWNLYLYVDSSLSSFSIYNKPEA